MRFVKEAWKPWKLEICDAAYAFASPEEIASTTRAHDLVAAFLAALPEAERRRYIYPDGRTRYFDVLDAAEWDRGAAVGTIR